MATLYYKIFPHHQKKDGTFNVKICLTHKGKQVYHSTTHHAGRGQLKRDMSIKDNTLLRDVMADVERMERKLSALGNTVSDMDPKRLLAELTKTDSMEAPDFVAFCIGHLDTLTEGYRRSLRPTVYSIRDFFGPSYPATGITSEKLREFEKYVSGKRTVVRRGRDDKERTMIVDGATANGVYWIMNGFRVLFNACRAKNNTEYSVLIPNRPFDYYKMPRRVKIRKKGGDLSIEDIVKIRDMELNGRPAMARDIFMLSFYLCGINAKDIYDREWEVYDGRVWYRRSKTRGRRMDEALISVKIPPQAAGLVDRFGGALLRRRYSEYGNLMKALKAGLDDVAKALDLPALKFSHARHTFATLAFNACGFTKEEIAAALNHVDGKYAVTEHYIARDWSVIDKVQAGVLRLISGDNPIQISPLLP